ncbi:peptidoglycan bridge formation glycyltransferase FemA/FemB family protein [bacterium]|nr:peptidoglycan bridge formation glycyltransferase FemA/FemB family protein [bacterium]
MIVRPISFEEKAIYNQVVGHPLQSWEWGEFKKVTGQKVERIGFFEGNQLKSAIQISFHDLPGGYTVGYLPKGPMPIEEHIAAMKQVATKNNALFIKIEPNIMTPVVATGQSAVGSIQDFLVQRGAKKGRSIFTHYTFALDLSKTEDELFAALHSKTRYNVRLAIKKGVQIIDDTSKDGLEIFIKLLEETTNRKNFHAHDAEYYRQMWHALGRSGMMKIFHAVYNDTVVVSWIIFLFNGKLYYPYGASSSLHREVMASNLMMWEVINYGKSHGAKMFDMWGALGPDPNPKNPWYGFHHFKEGYGAQLMENFQTFDFVYNPGLYGLFNVADRLRQVWLHW